MRKNILIKIIITAVLVLIGTAAILIIKHIDKEKTIAKAQGTITIELVDLDNNKTSKEFKYYEGDTLWSIMEKNYEVRYTTTQYGIFLYDIDEIKTDGIHTYIAIYLDDVYSSKGISYIELKDGLLISLREAVL